MEQAYDAAGEVTFDGVSTYLYDGEGRICAAKSEPIPGTYVMTEYIYDSQGNRVGKGSITTLSCNKSTNGFVAKAGYVTGLHGEQMTETNGTTLWAHTNVFANGSLIATYHDTNLYFAFEDWLGTKRAEDEVSSNGTCLNTYYSLPFGNDLTTTGTCTDATEHHYTGKERDAESGLDYFGARYYASSMGRFVSPDWSAKAEPVPYSKLDDPQTLNLYGYLRNNPLGGIDPDGHYFVVLNAHDQKFYQNALRDLYRRPGGRELVNSLANSDRPVLLDRRSLDTANTGIAGVTTAMTVSGQPGVAGAHVTVGTDADLMAGNKMAPGKVSSGVTTGHELEHANDGITAGQNSLQAGAAAMAAGDAPSAPGANNTIGGTAQSRAEGIMGEKTDMNKKDATSAVQGILNSGQQQWKDNANKPQ